MDRVSIILSTRQCTGNNVVEIVGECEKEYNELTLYSLASEVIKIAIECEGSVIPWTGEPQYQKFCYAFKFGSEEAKKLFLRKLYETM